MATSFRQINLVSILNSPASSDALRQRRDANGVHRVGGGLGEAVDGAGQGVNLRVTGGGADFGIRMLFGDGFAVDHTVIIRHPQSGAFQHGLHCHFLFTPLSSLINKILLSLQYHIRDNMSIYVAKIETKCLF